MSTLFPPDSRAGKEYRKWDKPHPFEKYPQLVYKARKRPDGVIVPPDPTRPGECLRRVHDDDELRRALEEGWRESPQEALDHLHALEEDISTAAAHRHHEDNKMSAKAKEEAAAADDATADHVPEVPRQPVQRKKTKPRRRAS